MKKSWLFSLSALTFIQFVSAAQFSIGEFFDAFDSETLLLGTVFLIIFALIFFSTSKLFINKYKEPNKPIAGVISFGLSLLIIYGIYKSNIQLENYAISLGLSEELLAIIVPIIFLAGVGYLIYKVRLNTLWIIGAFFILASLTGFVYEQGLLLTLGIGLIALFLLIKIFGKKKGGSGSSRPTNKKLTIIVVVGIAVLFVLLNILPIKNIIPYGTEIPTSLTIILIGLAVIIMIVLLKRNKSSSSDTLYGYPGVHVRAS